MKTSTKILVSSFAMLAGFSLLNNYIIKSSDKQNIQTNSLLYNTKYGKISYISCGKGKPLILLHDLSIGSSKSEFQSIINLFSKKYKVYAFDMLGFGYSDKPNISYSAYLFVTILNNFIIDIIGEPVSVIASGNSSALIALSYKFIPSNFNKIIFISPFNKNNNNISKLKYRIINTPIIGTTLYNYYTSKHYIKKQLEKHSFFNNSLKEVNNRFYASHYKGINNKYLISSLISNYIYLDLKKILKSVNISTLIMFGNDNIVDNSYLSSDLLITAIVPNTKTLPHYENPKIFFEIASQYID